MTVFVLPRVNSAHENVLADDELLASIELPAAKVGSRSRYHKVMDRETWTHAVVSAAVVLDMEQEVCRSARIVLGGVAPIPWRLPEVERMLTGQRITEELAAKAGEASMTGARALSKKRLQDSAHPRRGASGDSRGPRVTVDGRFSRRDFLRLRTTEHGRLLEVSCRTLFMRSVDATIGHEDVVEWEPWMGEPPAVIHRRSADDLLEAFRQTCATSGCCGCYDAEWLDSIEGASRIEAAISAFSCPRRRRRDRTTPAPHIVR
jgi:hypothetical protein